MEIMLKNHSQWDWPSSSKCKIKAIRSKDGSKLRMATIDHDVFNSLLTTLVGTQLNSLICRAFENLNDKTFRKFRNPPYTTDPKHPLETYQTHVADVVKTLESPPMRSMGSGRRLSMPHVPPMPLIGRLGKRRGIMSDHYASSHMQDLYTIVTKEIMFYRASKSAGMMYYDNRGPPCVLRLDIKELHSSISHSVALGLLRGIAITEDWLEFFKRYLEAPV